MLSTPVFRSFCYLWTLTGFTLLFLAGEEVFGDRYNCIEGKTAEIVLIINYIGASLLLLFFNAYLIYKFYSTTIKPWLEERAYARKLKESKKIKKNMMKPSRIT
eukprot:UN28055